MVGPPSISGVTLATPIWRLSLPDPNVRKSPRPPRPKGPRGSPGGGLRRAFHAAWLYGGIPFLAACAAAVALGRLPGLADFLFWLAAVWIVLVRYVEFSLASGESLQPSRIAFRQWRRFSAILVVASVGLYALARVVAPGGPP
jgi:hypothetical protein